MVLRSFTAQHKLQDAEEQYLQAVYRFRDAENKQSLSYADAKREMNRHEANLFRLRHSIYSKDLSGILKVREKRTPSGCCPVPAWNSRL